MSAPEEPRSQWSDAQFWERWDTLESRHRQIQSRHELARRRLDRASGAEAAELRDAWRTYCEVIAELDRTADEIAALHTGKL